jgi:hypothetical protein
MDATPPRDLALTQEDSPQQGQYLEDRLDELIAYIADVSTCIAEVTIYRAADADADSLEVTRAFFDDIEVMQAFFDKAARLMIRQFKLHHEVTTLRAKIDRYVLLADRRRGGGE